MADCTELIFSSMANEDSISSINDTESLSNVIAHLGAQIGHLKFIDPKFFVFLSNVRCSDLS